MTIRILLAVAAVVGFADVANAKTCVLAGGEATMVTRDLAEFMAKAALGNSIKAKGLKAEGVPKLTCNAPSPLSYCLAQQKACK
jgi:hypothetical protein